MFRGIRIFALCAGPAVGDCSSVQITVSATPNFSDPNAATYLLDQYNLPDLGPGHTSDDTRVEDIPGTQIDLTVTNNSPDPVIIAYTIVGHTN